MSINAWADTEALPTGLRPTALEARRDSVFDTLSTPVRRGALREMLTLAYHDRKRILLAFLIPLLCTVVLCLIPTPKFTSDATLMLRLGREYLYTPETGDAGSSTPMAYDREQTMRAELEILTSRDVLDAVLAKMGPATIYPALAQMAPEKQHERALLEIKRNVDATLVKDTNVVKLAFTHPNATTSAQVLNALIGVYLDRRRSIFAATGTDAARAHVESLRQRLAQTEGRLDKLKRTQQIQSFAEQQSLLLAQKQTIELKLDDSSLALAQSRSRAGTLETSLQATPQSIVLSNETQRSEALDSARKTLLDLRLKERDLSSKFSDNYVGVQDVRADIGRTEAFIKELEANPNRAVKTGRSTVRDVVESDLVKSRADESQASASRKVLLAQHDTIVARLNRLAASQRELESLDRDRKLLESALVTANRRLEDDLVNRRLDADRKSNVSIVQAARTPLEARSIRGVILAVGTAFSLLCAVFVAFVSALWRDTFITPVDVERQLGLPLLAAVPRGSLQ